MDHAEATASHATERYLLGELTAAEADAFERHFFDCVDCADELRVGMRFMNGGRGLAQEAAAPAAAPIVRLDERRDERRPRRSAWLPAAIAAALVLAVGAPILMRQQGGSGPSMEVASYAYLAGEQRAETSVPSIGGQAVLAIDIPTKPSYARYEARLQQPGGATLTLPLPAPDPEGADPSRLAVRGLYPGLHELVILGIDAAGRPTELARYKVNVHR